MWVYFYTSVSEVAQPDEAMLFWRLTVKAKNILFIQRDKLTVDRAKTHGMLGVWNREFIYENKEIQEERNPVNVCTEKNVQGSVGTRGSILSDGQPLEILCSGAVV